MPVLTKRMMQFMQESEHLAAGWAVADVLVILIEQLMLWQELFLFSDWHRAAPSPARQPCPESRHKPAQWTWHSPETCTAVAWS